MNTLIRHKAIYEYKIRKNFKMAEKILLETIDLLEVTPLRIKYDIYFELGEVYRLMDTELDNYEKSQKYYLEAVQFAERVHDFNLYSNSQLGIMLLSIKHEKEIDNDILRTIISEISLVQLLLPLYIKRALISSTVPSYRSDIKALFIPFIFLFLYYSFYDRLRIHFYLPHSDLFLLIKTECHHIALIQMLAAQVINHNYRLH